MGKNINQKIDQTKNEFNNIEIELSNPAIHSDPLKSKQLNRKYNELKQIIDIENKIENTKNDLEAGNELLKQDKTFQTEVNQLKEKLKNLTIKKENLLIPKDPNNARDVIMEIKAGAGGDESALFVSELLKMYEKYFAQQKNWKVQILEKNLIGIGGIKNVQISIRSNNLNNGVWAKLKYEAGVHRVQRIPITESQGRIHTSAVAVLVMPQIDDDTEIEITPDEINVDVYRSSGPGGQGVNTTDSAVRITHKETGIVVTSQNQRSQIQNKAQALNVLKSRLLEKQINEQLQESSDLRKSQVRTADRSERIRTYNFPENRISDHRTGYKSYNLDKILENGLLEPIIDLCIQKENEKYLTISKDKKNNV